MSDQAGTQGAPEDGMQAAPYSIADLAADAADVQRLLHLGKATVKLPDQRAIVLPDGVITERALAQVAGLDTYGD